MERLEEMQTRVAVSLITTEACIVINWCATMNKFTRVIIGVALFVVSTIALAPLIIQNKIPDSIWGITIGTLTSLVGTLIPAGKEKFVIEIPSNYKAKINVVIEEQQ